MIPTDISGNSLITQASGNTIKITLKLSNGETRNIGVVDKAKRTLITSRNRDKHLHFNLWSYGFNIELMEKATRFDRVLINEKFGDEKHKYLIPRSVILEQGQKASVRQRGGYERQIFLNFDTIKTFELKN